MQIKCLKIRSITLAFLLATSARGESRDSYLEAGFEANPFVGVCENVALLKSKDYGKARENWDHAINDCKANVQVLPDTGFFSAMLGVLGKITPNDQEKIKVVDFLRQLGQKTIDNLDYNATQTERQIFCAKALAEKDHADDPKDCAALIADLKAAISEKGSEYRVELELMKYTSGVGNRAASSLRSLFGQTYPGEKLELSEEERNRASALTAEVDRRVAAEMEAGVQANLKLFAEAKAKVGEAEAFHDTSIAPWFRSWYLNSNKGTNPDSPQARLHWNNEISARKQLRFDEHYKTFSAAMGAAPIVNYLEKRIPSEAEITAAAAKLLANNRKVRQDVADLMEKTSAHPTGHRKLTEQEKIDELLKLMQNGAVVRSVLGENPSHCGSAAAVLHYISNRKTTSGVLAVAGLAGASVLAPALVGSLGTYVGVAGAGFTITSSALTGALSTAAGTYDLYSKYENAKDGERRVMAYAHSVDDKLGAGKAIAETSELQDTRNAFAIHAAVLATTVAAGAGSAAYSKYFAGAKSQAPFTDYAALEIQAHQEQSQAVGAFIAAKAKGIKQNFQETVVDEYVAAWKQGKNLPSSGYNIAKRMLLVPRSRAQDPLLLNEELEKFHETQIFDFALNGMVEVANQGKMLVGGHLGISAAPIGYRLSMPASAIAGAFVYPQVYKLGKPIVDHYMHEKQKAIDDADEEGVLGLSYMKDWLTLDQMDLKAVRSLANENSELIIDWIKGLDSQKPGRPLLPRFYQFRLHGLLADNHELAEFEILLAQILEENARRVHRKEKPTGDPWVKTEILRRLQAHPTFAKKKPSELQLLTMAFDPPVFPGQKKGDLSWFKEVRDGNPTRYNNMFYKHSDLFWLRQAAENPEMKSIEEYFGPQPSALKVMVAHSQAYEEAQKFIREKKARWESNASLPREKIHLATRTDMPFFVEPKLTWADGTGQQRIIEKEIEYWELLSAHDGFADIRKKWLANEISDKAAISQVRNRVPDLAVMHIWQADSLTQAKEQDPIRETPLDPLPKDVCKIQEDNPYFANLAEDFSSPGGSAICRYYASVYAWRWVALSDQEFREKKAGAATEREQIKAQWKEKALSVCSEPDRAEKLARVFQVKTGELNDLLSCHN